MARKWIKTAFPGVRYREHPTRRYGIRLDRYFSIRYKLNGRDKEEGLGWSSAGIAAQKAVEKLAKLKEAQRTGEGCVTLAMTEQYSHLSPDKLRRAVKTLEASMDKAQGKIVQINDKR
jgi:hypothetical protein